LFSILSLRYITDPFPLYMDHLISFTTPQINTVYGLVHLKYVNVTGKVHPIKGHKGPEGE